MIVRISTLAILACLAIPFAGPVRARPGGGLDALVDGSRANLGKRTRLTGLRCADTGGSGGLVCKTEHRGRVVAVSAKRTGGRTSAAAARRLASECGGLAGFDKPGCTFVVEVTPTGIAKGSVDAGHGKRPLVTIEADSFDLF